MSASMSIASVPVSSVPRLSGAPGAQSSASATASSPQSAAQQFEQYANMTPAQRLHAQMLAKLGMTEDQYKALTPADKQKVDDTIRDMIKKQLTENNDTRTGMITDKTA